MSQGQSIADIMITAYFALKGVMDNEVLKAQMAVYGYGPAKIDEGWAVYNRLKASKSAQVNAEYDETKAYEELGAAWAALKVVYQEIKQVAKAIFGKPEPAKLKVLGFDQPMPRTLDAFAEAARKLFVGLEKPEISGPMALYGYPPARVATERLAYTRLLAARDAQSQATIDLGEVTKQKQADLAALVEWMRCFNLVMRVATKNEPPKSGS